MALVSMNRDHLNVWQSYRLKKKKKKEKRSTQDIGRDKY